VQCLVAAELASKDGDKTVEGSGGEYCRCKSRSKTTKEREKGKRTWGANAREASLSTISKRRWPEKNRGHSSKDLAFQQREGGTREKENSSLGGQQKGQKGSLSGGEKRDLGPRFCSGSIGKGKDRGRV